MKNLKSKLSKIAFSLREDNIRKIDINTPRLVEISSYYADGRTFKRKRIILRSNGCSIATCTMCPFTNETTHGSNQQIFETNYINQIKRAFSDDSSDDYEALCIYNDGSFFSEAEMPKKVRIFIYSLIAKSKCDLLVVESSPQFINSEILEEASFYLKGKKLSVGIGLQSANSIVRKLCINAPCSMSDFEKALTLLNKYNCLPKVYLLIKPPFLTEQEAILDAIDSAKYLYAHGIQDVTFCPVRISKRTIIAMLYSFGMYSPPWLWTIINILKEVSSFIRPRVACLNLRETDFESIHAKNCEKCSDAVVEKIEEMNITGNYHVFADFTCDCLNEYLDFLNKDNWNNIPIIERVTKFIKLIEEINC